MKPKINIAVLFNDIFNLHGDRGNIAALKRISEQGQVCANIEYIDFSTKDFKPEHFDIIYCGPGELSYFQPVKNWLEPHKNALEEFIQKGKIMLVTGTSLSLFGGITLRTEGHALEGLHIISSGFREREYVYGGDLYYTAVYNHVEMEIYGSQIRMTDQITGLSANEQAFGHIIYGSSCKGTPGKEGVIINNSIFTNTLGPLLVLNPWLTKEIINVALKNKGESFRIEEPDMSLEKKSLEAKKKFASKAYAQQPQAL